MIRASSIHRFRNCSGSLAAVKGLPEAAPKSWTEDGKIVHDALRTMGAVKVPDHLVDVVDSMASSMEYVLDKVLPNEDGIKRMEVIRDREEPYYVEHEGERIISGHPDFIQLGEIYGKRVALILDFKSGFLDVEAPELNSQLRAYAVAIWQEYAVDAVYASIIPRFGWAKEPVCYSTDDLGRALLDLVDIERATREASAVRTPSVNACRYCLARATANCPETLRLPSILKTMPNLLQMTPAEKGKLLDLCQIVTGNIAAIKDRLKEEIVADPKAVDGWHLVPGDTRSSIPDASKAYQVCSEVLTQEEFQSTLRVGVTDLKNTLKAKLRETENVKGKEAASRVADLLAPVTEKTQNQPKLEKVLLLL